ncbi:GNAT family N-acetyltransferase [Echinicola sp. CAU 1574]|uniref:GNAT family N-acetyltransferase n=1 Tax=Echinicola arenosa TaxID=2774144 RepID=A0ABR9AKJ7_9BACT|nr:GNAT family protein [Echinicola arenosa]MBD8488841.1 GNAT family N-acetyltransferase [Echinicola arenosa]
MENWLQETILEGEKVKLIPLQKSHRNELLEVTSDGKLWELWFTSVPSAETIDQYISKAMEEKTAQSSLPFVIMDKSSQKIVGCTRFCNAALIHRRLEIGYTWYAKSAQRTGINTECKYLMLQYAFEHLNCIAVQFKTDWFNLPSRNAISRLGAKQDGVLRNDRLNADGTYRDTVVFSIIKQEWHGVKKNLKYKMEHYRNLGSTTA